MSKKQLLTESEIRRFMKLANLEPLAKNVVRESWQQQDENAPPPAATMEEAELTGKEEAEPQGKEMPMDAGLEGGEKEGGEGGLNLSDETKQKIKELIAQETGKPVDEIELELGDEEAEDDEDMVMDMSDDEEGEEEEGEEEEGEEEEGEDEEAMDETLSEDALVETVLARVTARLVAEAAKKGAAKKDGETSAAKKMAKLRAMKKGAEMKKGAKKPAAKESLELKGDKLEEATSAEGGGPLLKQGKNKFDVYKGHADMKMAKGDKGGSGGHSLETVSAKAEHTVTHGGKNLATLGGNKKKV